LPQHWNSSEYRKRARKWREKVASLSEGQRERTLCLDLAQGYERLADQVRAICLGGPLRALRRSLIPTALRALIWINFPGASMVINRRPAHLFLDSFRFTCNYLVEKGRPMGRGAHGTASFAITFAAHHARRNRRSCALPSAPLEIRGVLFPVHIEHS
jgi:hypothetical protein